MSQPCDRSTNDQMQKLFQGLKMLAKSKGQKPIKRAVLPIRMIRPKIPSMSDVLQQKKTSNTIPIKYQLNQS